MVPRFNLGFGIHYNRRISDRMNTVFFTIEINISFQRYLTVHNDNGTAVIMFFIIFGKFKVNFNIPQYRAADSRSHYRTIITQISGGI